VTALEFGIAVVPATEQVELFAGEAVPRLACLAPSGSP
jgi:hypothetical protein